jgi:hypothetical protein
MDKVIITRPIIGICWMQACVEDGVSDEEILSECNRLNPAGTQLGWSRIYQDDEEQEKTFRPVRCNDHSNRRHVILVC